MSLNKDSLCILIVDDDEIDRTHIKRLLERNRDIQITLDEAVCANDGLKLIEYIAYDCILLDYKLPDADAITFLKKLNELKTETPPVILQTTMKDGPQAIECLALGAQDYLVKGEFDGQILIRSIKYSVERDALVKEKLNAEHALLIAQQRIESLEKFLPICSNCKKIRDEGGTWWGLERYITDHSDTHFSHSVCPDCLKVLYPDMHLNREV
jgi:CheY-like chemotaxis protein